MTHYSGAYTEPTGPLLDGYENTVGNNRTWIRDRSAAARRTLTHDDLALVCSECGNGHAACDCSAAIRRLSKAARTVDEWMVAS